MIRTRAHIYLWVVVVILCVVTIIRFFGTWQGVDAEIAQYADPVEYDSSGFPDRTIKAEIIHDLQSYQSSFIVAENDSRPYSSYRILMAMILEARTCAPCMNEIHEYSEIINEMLQGQQEIGATVLIYDVDLYRQRRFAKALNLDLETRYSLSLSSVNSLLAQSQDAAMGLFFIDTASQSSHIYEPFYSSRFTSREYKIHALTKALTFLASQGHSWDEKTYQAMEIAKENLTNQKQETQ
jgi:hypothetical protein